MFYHCPAGIADVSYYAANHEKADRLFLRSISYTHACTTGGRCRPSGEQLYLFSQCQYIFMSRSYVELLHSFVVVYPNEKC